MRTGQCWNPRTPAEEAVVHVAVSYGYTDIAFDLIGVDDDLRATGRPPGRQHPTRCPDPGAGGGLHLR